MNRLSTSAALWVVRSGALLSVVALAVGCAANDWNPGRVLAKSVALSAPYAVVLWCLASRARASRTGWGLALASATAVATLPVFFLAIPSLLGGHVEWPVSLVLGLFPLVQLGVAATALRARRRFPKPTPGRRSRMLIAFAGIVYLLFGLGMFVPSFERPPYVTNQSHASVR